MAAESVPTAPKAQLFLTLDWDQLRERTGAATTIGGSDTGTLFGSRHGPADRLRRRRHPHRPRRRRRGPRLGPRTSPVHLRVGLQQPPSPFRTRLRHAPWLRRGIKYLSVRLGQVTGTTLCTGLTTAPQT